MSVQALMVVWVTTVFAGMSSIALTSCDGTPGVVKDTVNVLGTYAEIELAGLSSDKASEAMRAVEKDLEAIDRIGYTFGPTSELAELNSAISMGESMKVSPELKELIHKASEGFYPVSTDGLKTAEKC